MSTSRRALDTARDDATRADTRLAAARRRSRLVILDRLVRDPALAGALLGFCRSVPLQTAP